MWIGHGVIFLSDALVGQGAVIGAGSIVAKDVPPYSVYIGNSVKKYRFSEEIIEELLKIDFTSLDEEALNRFAYCCDEKVTEDNVQKIVQELNKVEG